jgi:hypothetical protein
MTKTFRTVAWVLGATTGFLGLSVISGCSAGNQAFVARGGVESGPGSSLWGDGSSGPEGMEIGCIPRRRLAVLITVHNRTKHTVTLLGAGGAEASPAVIERAAAQVRLAPPPPKGDLFVSGLRGWSRRNPQPVAIPPGRDGWVQSNFLMRNCALLSRPVTVNKSISLRYRVGGSLRRQAVSVPAAPDTSDSRASAPFAADQSDRLIGQTPGFHSRVGQCSGMKPETVCFTGADEASIGGGNE